MIRRSLLPLTGLLALSLLTCCVAVGHAQYGTGANRDTAGSPYEVSTDEGPQRRREGSRVELEGYFLLTSDRITFCTLDELERFQTLENLSLERLAKIARESGRRLNWRIEGTVTEYLGKNYLLIERAVVMTESSEPL